MSGNYPSNAPSSSSSSSFSGHRRHPSRESGSEPLLLPPQSLGGAVWTNNGLTPAFELHDDPLSAPPTAVSLQRTPPRHRVAHQHQASTAINLADALTNEEEQAQKRLERSESWGQRGRGGAPSALPRTEADRGTNGTGLKAIQHLGGWARDPSHERQRSMSPSLSGDRAHTTHSRVASPSIDIHRRAITPSPASASPTREHHESQRHTPLGRRDSLQRKGLDGVAAALRSPSVRASPIHFKSAGRAGHEESYSAKGAGRLYDDDDADDDEEAGKGHGKGGGALLPRRKSTGANGLAVSRSPAGGMRPASRSKAIEGARNGDGRNTPAQYRPLKQPLKANSTPAQYINAASQNGRTSTSSHHSYVAMNGQSGTTSPLIVPQARRGAINLKTKRTRRRGGTKGKRRAIEPSRPFWESLGLLSRRICWHVAHPVLSIEQGKSYLVQTIRDTDKAFRDPFTGQRVWWPDWLEGYIPLLIWLVISLSSTVTVLTFHTQVFKGLDELSRTLQRMGLAGKLSIGGLIFLTTFPPLPLYSTLIVLCGFSFGLWQGFVISYIAALSGAVVVYLLSKSLLRKWMDRLMAKSGGLKKVVKAIEKRPKLLFLIRLAPYPYNLMNTLLASSPTLTFKTYFLCTALALPKLLVHCGLGASIKNFAAYHGEGGDPTDASHGQAGQAAEGEAKGTGGSTAETAKRIAGFVGVGLCIGIFIYLLSVARKAVDEELDSDAESGEYDELDEGEEEEEEADEVLDDDDVSDDGDQRRLLSSAQSPYRDGGEGSSLALSTGGANFDAASPFKLQAAPRGAQGTAAAGRGNATLYEVPADAVAFRIASPESLEMSSVYTSSTSPAFNLSGRGSGLGRSGFGAREGADQPYCLQQGNGGGAESTFDLLGVSGLNMDMAEGEARPLESGQRCEIDFMEEEAERSFASAKAGL